VPDALDEVRSALRSRTPVDERERGSIAQFLTELDRLAAPFDEWADEVHVTGSAVVVSERGVALHRHKRLGTWLQPGGHIDPGETPWEAARREAHEELGLAAAHPPGGARLVHVDVHRGAKERCRLHLDLRYLVVAPPLEPAPGPGESPLARWFTIDEALAVADEGLVGALRALREGTDA
jgi:8-oxo-dGTP pyrophosphatase MutT (NUDIX family)